MFPSKDIKYIANKSFNPNVSKYDGYIYCGDDKPIFQCKYLKYSKFTYLFMEYLPGYNDVLSDLDKEELAEFMNVIFPNVIKKNWQTFQIRGIQLRSVKQFKEFETLFYEALIEAQEKKYGSN